MRLRQAIKVLKRNHPDRIVWAALAKSKRHRKSRQHVRYVRMLRRILLPWP